MRAGLAVAAILLTANSSVAAAAFPFRTLALSGEPAPGTPAGVIFTGFREGVVNDKGDVAFSAFVGGPGVVHTHPSNAYGIWRDQAGVLSKVMRSGDQAADLPLGVNYYLPNTPRIDGQGRTAFSAEAPGQSTHGVFSEGHGSLRLVARETAPIPGSTVTKFTLFSLVPLMSDDGSVLFTSFIGTGGIGGLEALFTDRSGQLELIIKNNDVAPGIPGRISGLGSTPVFNDEGKIAFSGRFTGSTYPNDHALWTEHFGEFTLLARSGQAPTGMPAGVIFSQLREPRINNSGQVMFHGSLTGPGISSTNDGALWLHNAGNIQLLAREGDAATGLAPGTNFSELDRAYLNGVGEATFVGKLTGLDVTMQNDTGVWTTHGNALALVAREGDPAPGTPTGTTFGDFDRLGNGLGFQFNRRGQIAFEVQLRGPGITAASDTGIWVTDFRGNLRLVAREGDSFDVNDDPSIQDLRTVRSTELHWYSGGGEDGYGKALNNSGELMIALTFMDNSGGAFVISTVPEPSVIIMLPIFLALVWHISRRGATRQCRWAYDRPVAAATVP